MTYAIMYVITIYNDMISICIDIADLDIYTTTMYDIMDIISKERNKCVIMGDMNIDLLKFESHRKTNAYLDNIFAHGFLPVIVKPTSICNSSATLIDHIYIYK